MVAKIDKNPAMVQVAKPILQFDLADAKTTKEILPNESINYKILVKNFTSASNISETKLKYKFNINKLVWAFLITKHTYLLLYLHIKDIQHP